MFLKYLRVQWDRTASCVCLVGGLVAILLGWVGVSDTNKTSDQIPYLVSGGLVGLYLLGLGAMLWLSADARDEWRKLDAIEQLQRAAAEGPEVSRRNPDDNGSGNVVVAGAAAANRGGSYQTEASQG